MNLRKVLLAKEHFEFIQFFNRKSFNLLLTLCTYLPLIGYLRLAIVNDTAPRLPRNRIYYNKRGISGSSPIF